MVPVVRKGHKVPYAGSVLSKFDASGGPDACWPWLGAVTDRGYGSLRVEGKTVRAHRWVWELLMGRLIAPGMDLHHTCWNRLCVNPGHLEEATPEENRHNWRKRRSA